MAKIIIPFDNETYDVDESSLSTASAQLKSHLSTVMNGSGATINFDGTSYNVDSAKLSAATSDFISHLGTIAGNGYKVVVNGVEYNIDSTKMSGAIADLHAVLGGLHSSDGSGSDKYDDTFPITWNSLDVIGNPTIVYDNFQYVKISSLTPSPEMLENLVVCFDNKVFHFDSITAPSIDGVVTGVKYTCNSIVNGVSNTSILPLYVIYQAGDLGGFILPETGIYFIDVYSTTNLNYEIKIDYASNYGERHDDTIAEGAYYANLATGTFYSEMPETVSAGDAYLYGDYLYQYNASIDGWDVSLATAEFGVLTFVPDYPVTDKNQTEYDPILESINGKGVKRLISTFENCTNLSEAPVIPNNATNINGIFANCTNLTKAPVIPNSVTHMSRTFQCCTNLTKAPVIPNSVTHMSSTFQCCTNLTKAPVIPNSVTNMECTFSDCTNLTEAPVIPNSVTNMSGTFQFCTSLTGTVEINANPNNYISCFSDVDMSKITLTGSSTMLNEIGATGLNYTAQ